MKHNHKLLVILGIILGVLLLALALIAIFAFKGCPPQGPWPKPPWCSGGVELKAFDNGLAFKGYTYDNSTEEYISPHSRSRNFTFGVAMMDVWGNICYDDYCEDNRKYVESSFDRLHTIGTDFVIVTDMTVLNDNLSIRFAENGGAKKIEQEELNYITRMARKDNLKVFLMTNLYDAVPDARKNIDYNNPSKEMLDGLLKEWETVMIEQSKKASEAQVDYLIINPRDINFLFSKDEDQNYVNNGLAHMIPYIQEHYKGRLCVWGDLKDIDTPGLLNTVNCVILDRSVGLIMKNSTEDVDSITAGWNKYFKELDDRNLRMETYIMLLMSSYNDSMHKGWIEPVGIDYDKLNVKFFVDEKEQALVYEGMFRAAESHKNIRGVISYGYWWTDRMYPQSKIDILRNDISHSIRGKDAEDVIYRWNVIGRQNLTSIQ